MSHRDVRPIARRQDGLLTRAQALSAGLTSRQYDYRRRRGGPWQDVLPGVVAAFTGALTAQQYRRAALLWAGQFGPDGNAAPVVLGCRTAVVLHGLQALESAPVVDLLVPRPRRLTSTALVAVRTTGRPEPSPLHVRGLAVCSVARAVADCSRELSRLREVRALVGEAVQTRRTTVERLAVELASGPRRGSALLARTLAEVGAGLRTPPEWDLRDIVAASSLPEPGWNRDILVNGVLLACGDAVWDAPPLVLEVDSRQWHLRPADWEHTMRRHNRLCAAGYTVLHFPPSRLVHDRDRVRQEIVTTYERLVERAARASA